MDNKKYKRFANEVAKHKYQCKCGHKVFIDFKEEKRICDWCGRYVYKDKKIEFKERLENARKNI